MMKDNNALDIIANDVRNNIHTLVQGGYSPLLIEAWIRESIVPKGLTITKDYRILLSASGKEIKLHPLAKTLYLFFLINVPGCRIKELPQHEEEILKIYKHLTVFDNTPVNNSRISRLVDPHSKSFLEKCATISHSFRSEMSNIEAEHYCILGGRGEPRRIILDRCLVKWETDILQKTV